MECPSAAATADAVVAVRGVRHPELLRGETLAKMERAAGEVGQPSERGVAVRAEPREGRGEPPPREWCGKGAGGPLLGESPPSAPRGQLAAARAAETVRVGVKPVVGAAGEGA
eukprot:RCo024093